MATVIFSVPFDVKEAYDKAFCRQNKSAVLTELLRQVVDERRRRAKAVGMLFSFAEYPVASGLRSRSGYFGGVGCCGELYSATAPSSG